MPSHCQPDLFLRLLPRERRSWIELLQKLVKNAASTFEQLRLHILECNAHGMKLRLANELS
jgi:hypothetical protein